MPAAAVIACWCGDIAEGERVLAPLRAFGPPLADMIQPMPFPAMQRLLDDAFPDGTHNYWKSSFVRELSDEVIDRSSSTPTAAPRRCRRCWSSTTAARPAGSDRRHGLRPAPRGVQHRHHGAMGTGIGRGCRHIAWARAFYDALEPYSGSYLLNFLSEGPTT